MIKNCILILVVGLIMLGCGNRQVRQIEQVREDSTELTIKTYYDTIHLSLSGEMLILSLIYLASHQKTR